MTYEAQKIAHLLSLNGGQIVGKTRLQKTFYFLEALEVGFGFDYEYHHYGPYSEDLSNATDDAVALDLVTAESRTSQHLQSYVVYSSKEHIHGFDDQSDDRRRAVLRILAAYDAISIELAATIDFLRRAGYSDPISETTRRKPTKSTRERLAKANRLLGELSLA